VDYTTWAHAHANLSVEDMIRFLHEAPPYPAGAERDAWAGWKNTQQAHIRLLEELIQNPLPYPAGKFQGRGIVCSVNAKPGHSSGKSLKHGYLPGAFCMVKELRRHGCTLPVTFTHMGPLEWDWNLSKLMDRYGVQVIDLCEAEKSDPMRILAGFESKIASIWHAPYRDVLYLDADNFPLLNPEYLFDSEQYRHYGAIFWPDVPPQDRDAWLPSIIWENCGMPFHDVQAAESGQVMINKEKCWIELQACRWMNAHSDFFYRFIFGDKDTFVLSWLKVQQMVRDAKIPWPEEKPTGYAMTRHAAGGNDCSLFQHDFSRRVAFQHCTRNKPDLHGFPNWGGLINRAHCEKHLEELRQNWNGRLWDNQSPTLEERAHIVRLVGKLFQYERIGLGGRPLRLLQDGAIGLGRERCEANWSLFRYDGQTMIVISSIDGVPTMTLREQADGTWRGRWLEHERCEVALTPVSESEAVVA
jgi:hypothetical protein